MPVQQRRILGMFRHRGWFRDLASLCALLGFLFTSSTPGLSLAAMSGPGLLVAGPLGVYICHAQGGARSAVLPGQAEESQDEGCCLICQAAQTAHNAAPPQHFNLSIESAVVVRLHAENQAPVLANILGRAQARAPPAA